jgi:hypothetical protein
MLGHNKRLERKLKAEGGRQAWATVLESEHQWTSSGGVNMSPGQAGSFTIHQKLKLRVEPDGESPFEATVKQVFHDTHDWPIPQKGWSVTVIYDAADHSKVVIDVDKMPVGPGVDRDEVMARHERVMKRETERERMREMAAEAAVEGRPAAAPVPAGRAEQIRAVARDASLSPEEKRVRIMELSASMGAAARTMLAGDQVVQGGITSGSAAAVDALAKLADLRDRGVVTQEEFEAQKHKLLGE